MTTLPTPLATRTARLVERVPVELRTVLRPFGSLVTAQVAGTALGFLFWLLTARSVPAATVGLVSAAVTAQALLGKVATLGAGTHLIGELPLHDRAGRTALLRAALLASGIAGLLSGALLVAVVPLLERLGDGQALSAALTGPVAVTAFVAGTSATAVGLVLDHAVLAVRRSSLQVTRNLLAAGLRFPLAAALLVVGLDAPGALLACWAVPLAVSIAVVLRSLARDPGSPAPVTDPALRDTRDEAGSTGSTGSARLVRTHAVGSLRNHALDLSLSAGPLLLPVVAATVLDPTTYGRFAVAWLVATFVFLPPYMLATALFATSINGGVDDFLHRARRTVPAGLALSLALCVVCWVAGPQMLAVFGPGYAESSAPLLALLVPAGLWMVLKDHVVALWRVERSLGDSALVAAGGVLLEVLGAALGGVLGGATGLCLGWLAALTVQAYAAWPVVVAVTRRPDGTPSHPLPDPQERAR